MTDTEQGDPVQVEQAYNPPGGLIIATIEVPLTRGYVTRIYEADRVFTDGRSWSVALRGRDIIYACTNIGKKVVLLHSLLAPEWGIVDHADGNGLNNCRYNLRDGTGFRNRANSGLRSNNTSGYKGVTRHPGGWSARIQVNRKSIYLGYFNSPEAAADAYDEAAVRYFGEWALTNAMLAQSASGGTDVWQYPLPPPPEPDTHCKNGHEFTAENTYTYRSGKRECRTCRRDRKRRAWAARPDGGGKRCPPGCTCGRHRRAA